MRILPTETPALFAAAVLEAARELTSGGVVALPTETVYGLAANALDPAAVAKLYEAKGRPAHNPLIVHVASLEMARRCAAGWPARADLLASKHWPGPLTLVLPKAAEIPEIVTAGGRTVALRWPSHPFIQAVIRQCGFPLAAPSANRSNQVSPTSAAHVAASLGGAVPLIIDGGQCQVGIESTVFDIASGQVLRPGMISAWELEAEIPSVGPPAPGPLKSPGQLNRHYSPRARLRLAEWNHPSDPARIAASLGARLASTWVIAFHAIPPLDSFASVSVIPDDPEAYARALYAALHQADQPGIQLILVESPPVTPAWEGIRDRLHRAGGAPDE